MFYNKKTCIILLIAGLLGLCTSCSKPSSTPVPNKLTITDLKAYKELVNSDTLPDNFLFMEIFEKTEYMYNFTYYPEQINDEIDRYQFVLTAKDTIFSDEYIVSENRQSVTYIFRDDSGQELYKAVFSYLKAIDASSFNGGERYISCGPTIPMTLVVKSSSRALPSNITVYSSDGNQILQLK